MRWLNRRKDAPAPGGSFVIFSADQAAAMLWTFGEDELVPAARSLNEKELRSLWAAAGVNLGRANSLPLSTPYANDKLVALTCIEHFEGRMRPLRQERRRPKKQMPAELQSAQPVPPGTTPA